MTRDLEHPAAEQIRARLAGKTSRAFWRGLDELSATPAFRSFLEAEFPALAPADDQVDRRGVLKVMAASLALAGLTGCGSEPDEDALPYVNAPEFVTPGNAKWYATAVTFEGYAQPVLGKTHVGRPVKLEGNPAHPVVKGATDSFTQAALLALYDPDRSQAPQHMGRVATWSAFDAALVDHAAAMDQRHGEGLRLLTGQITSPSAIRQIDALQKRWPAARWHLFEPLDDAARRQASETVFGQAFDQHLQLDAAEVVVAFDDDLLGAGARQILHNRLWGERRRSRQHHDGDCRLFVAEPVPSITGVVADERLVVGAAQIGPLMSAVAHELGVASARPRLSLIEERWLKQAVTALQAHQGRGLVSIGAHHPAALQVMCLLINERLGSFGKTLSFTDPIAMRPKGDDGSLQALAADMAAGKVVSLVMLGGNPVYAAPVDLEFAAAMGKVPFRLHAGLHYDETAALSHWHVPLQHDLESWSDARAIDGTISIVQPLIRPFYDARSTHGFLDGLTGGHASDRAIVQATWRERWAQTFDENWRSALLKGFVVDSAAPLRTPVVAARPAPPAQSEAGLPDGLTVLLRADPTIWDGRFAGISWLQELPKPLTKLTWGNAIEISPQLAADQGLTNGDEVRLDVGGHSVTGPVWVSPGQEAKTIAVSLGYGRSRIGVVAQDLGYNAYLLRETAKPWQLDGARITATGSHLELASTQLHQAMDGFDFVRTVDLAHVPREAPAGTGATVADDEADQPTLFPTDHWDSPSWGMSIDLDLCTGCNACVSACVAENNIAMVGKDLVAQGREMFWLRVDHYYEGDPADPKQHFQPVPCMHCEKAPCEMGCPVNATVHSPDGLNLQVYNRCIGTRTCASFCPYKVRHFNWFEYTADDPEPIQAMRNPDVTVRARGVMEKCTYCIQRISAARIAAKIEDRPIEDGEVVTACQQACPTRAIVFGNVVDPGSAVSRRKATTRNYSLLAEANTRPRTTYLAKIESAAEGEAS